MSTADDPRRTIQVVTSRTDPSQRVVNFVSSAPAGNTLEQCVRSTVAHEGIEKVVDSGGSIAGLPTLVSAPSSLTVTYKGEDHINNTGQTTFTFSAKAIGAAAANRWVVVLMPWGNTSGDRTISGVTIGGVTATVSARQGTANGNRGACAMAWANVPAGTTADIAITFNSAFATDVQSGVGIDYYTVVGSMNPTPTASFAQNTAAESTWNPSVPAGGVAFAIGNPAGVGTRSVGADFSTDDNYVQAVAAIFRYAGFAANATGAAVVKNFQTSGWVSGAPTIPVVGNVFGVS